ncbi:10820_t:CDS:2 [Diversispora eburnea]|uniref:10820_t:CDS:1 n=1 Tax=Diversispora eburnea TaxID=1213867 RepID=A0A9N9BHF1_9GLOM|nr:10820_t:CDS:2 [Diversispora eburnea]
MLTSQENFGNRLDYLNTYIDYQLQMSEQNMETFIKTPTEIMIEGLQAQVKELQEIISDESIIEVLEMNRLKRGLIKLIK